MKKRGKKNSANQKKRNRPRRRRRLSVFAYFLIFLVIAVCGGIAAAVNYLKISSITVSGSTPYSKEQILDAAGIKTGQRLFLLNRKKAVQNITAGLPFVESARIKYKPILGITVILTQDTPYFAVSYDGGNVITDKSFKVLDFNRDRTKYGSLTVINGVGVMTAPKVGAIMPTTLLGKLNRASEILRGFKNNKLDKIGIIDVTSDYQLTAKYDSRITIILGSFADIDEKIEDAVYLIANKEIQDSEKGTLDVSQSTQSNKVSFTPA